MYENLLGGLTPRQFLNEYWQKKPLLIRQAVPGFKGLLDRDALFELACNPDVESRLVRQSPKGWALEHGPQQRRAFKDSKHPWTVLVQGLNLWLPSADELLHRFHFIPQARLDDLMVSYAVDGGGVGPHFDNYDVFLLQGTGQRRWQIAAQEDRSLLDDVPLKILRHFTPEHDWVLEPGDMLYLPPHWAHNGIAIGECTTYSIGFRSPEAQELGAEFLLWLQERLKLEGLYADPDLQEQDNSALIGSAMVEQVHSMLSAIRWDRDDIAAFLGDYLSEPKPHVFFEPPEPAREFEDFLAAVARSGLRLDRRSLMLVSANHIHLNGEPFADELAGCADEYALLARLADQRRLPAEMLASNEFADSALAEVLFDAYCNGFMWTGEDE